MKINVKLVKALRTKKLWSQDDLATACGISLRTVQRLEGDGQASPETIRALAAVFQVDYEYLQESGSHQHEYFNIQLGVALIAIFVAAIAISAWFLNQDKMTHSAFITMCVFLTVVCVLFATLTTRVTAEYLQWHFTFGFLGKKLALQDIASHRVVRNKVWWGLGLRLLPKGWLYCVSGLDAVEVVHKDGRITRIGTDEAPALDQAIQRAKMLI
ncbi:MAG: helix-turn-helix transcriptional regulator [Pseudomonadota bacterium]